MSRAKADYNLQNSQDKRKKNKERLCVELSEVPAHRRQLTMVLFVFVFFCYWSRFCGLCRRCNFWWRWWTTIASARRTRSASVCSAATPPVRNCATGRTCWPRRAVPSPSGTPSKIPTTATRKTKSTTTTTTTTDRFNDNNNNRETPFPPPPHTHTHTRTRTHSLTRKTLSQNPIELDRIGFVSSERHPIRGPIPNEGATIVGSVPGSAAVGATTSSSTRVFRLDIVCVVHAYSHWPLFFFHVWRGSNERNTQTHRHTHEPQINNIHSLSCVTFAFLDGWSCIPKTCSSFVSVCRGKLQKKRNFTVCSR